jgi:hypothetical protein
MAGVEGGMWRESGLVNTIAGIIQRAARIETLAPVPGETAARAEPGDSGGDNRRREPPTSQPEEAMRLVDVVLVSIVIGMSLGLLHTGLPGARAFGAAQVAASDCAQSMCERITWLRAPLLRRATSAE